MASETDVVRYLPIPPTSRSFWVTPSVGGGCYPGDRDLDTARSKLHALLSAGVTSFIDLTDEADGLRPYDDLLTAIAKRFAVDASVKRISVPDGTAATTSQISQALEEIDRTVGGGGRVYVHCWGGKGRTATVLGAYLARMVGGPEALSLLQRLWDAQVTHARDVGKRVPEMPAQAEAVRAWPLDDTWARQELRSAVSAYRLFGERVFMTGGVVEQLDEHEVEITDSAQTVALAHHLQQAGEVVRESRATYIYRLLYPNPEE